MEHREVEEVKRVEKLKASFRQFLDEASQLRAADFAEISTEIQQLLRQRSKRFYLTLASLSIGALCMVALFSHNPAATAASHPTEEEVQAGAISKRISNMNTQELEHLIDSVNDDINHHVYYQDETAERSGTLPKLTDPLDPQEEVALLGMEELASGDSGDNGPTGRPDPFAPLVQDYSTLGGTAPPTLLPGLDVNGNPVPKDILEDVEFVGLIDEKNPTEKVAILKINSPEGGPKTLIKKLGESFTLENNRIVLKKINRYQLSLTVNGKARSKALSPFVDNLKASEDTELLEDTSKPDAGGSPKNSPEAKPLKGLQE